MRRLTVVVLSATAVPIRLAAESTLEAIDLNIPVIAEGPARPLARRSGLRGNPGTDATQ